MPSTDYPTAYAGLSRGSARLLLAAFAVLLAGCVAVAGTVGKRLRPDAGDGVLVAAEPATGKDLELYRKVVEGVRRGRSYYDVAARELKANGYPTSSLFNWRPPTYAWLMGAMPSPEWGRWALAGLAAMAVVLGFRAMVAEGGPAEALVGGPLLAATFLWVFEGDAFLTGELWAGVLIALSLGLYAYDRPALAVGAGLFALFFRELAVPFVGLMVLRALATRRWRELAMWAGGLMLYAAFMAYHAGQVSQRVEQAGSGGGAEWLALGGLRFALSTARMGWLTYILPGWLAAVYVPACLVGLGGLRSDWGRRAQLTVAGYLAAFTVVGQWFNEYWGLMYAPLLVFGLVRAPRALKDLARAARGRVPAGGT
jgi:hypothetical protein